MKKRFSYAFAFIIALAMQGSAGAVSTEDLFSITSQDLADSLLGAGATVLPGAAHSGDPAAAGLFTGGLADGLGLDLGVILSTGDIFNAEITPNVDTATGTSFALPGDADVTALMQGQTTFDASALEFDFIPLSNVLDFTFVFASDEYNEITAGGVYGNDALVLLVDGVNIALVPKTTDAIAISTINQNSNPLWFNNNDPVDFPFPLSPPYATQYDGFSKVLTSRVTVEPGRSYHIKIAVADLLDAFVDTSVFLAPVSVQDLPVNTIGVYKDGSWFLDRNGNGAWDGTIIDSSFEFGLGLPAAAPVAGDWDGGGTSKIGIYSDGVWYLDNNGNGAWDGEPTDSIFTFGTGLSGAVPVTGDWNGNGTAKIGIYADGVWYLDTNGNGAWDGTPTDSIYTFGGGLSGAAPVTGDWDGTGTTKIGVYADGYWYLDNNGNGAWDGAPTDLLYAFGAGLPGAGPVTGDWDGTGTTKIGIFANGRWYLDYNGNGAWDSALTDRTADFGTGLTGAVPVAGRWN